MNTSTLHKEFFAAMSIALFVSLVQHTAGGGHLWIVAYFLGYTAWLTANGGRTAGVDGLTERTLLRKFLGNDESLCWVTTSTKIFMQLLGSFVGALIYVWLADTASYPMSNNDDLWKAFLMQCLLTMFLFEMLGKIDRANTLMNNLGVGFAYVSCVFAMQAFVMGTIGSINIDLMRIIASKALKSETELKELWVFALSPIVGLLLAKMLAMLDEKMAEGSLEESRPLKETEVVDTGATSVSKDAVVAAEDNL